MRNKWEADSYSVNDYTALYVIPAKVFTDFKEIFKAKEGNGMRMFKEKMIEDFEDTISHERAVF